MLHLREGIMHPSLYCGTPLATDTRRTCPHAAGLKFSITPTVPQVPLQADPTGKGVRAHMRAHTHTPPLGTARGALLAQSLWVLIDFP